MRMSNKKFGERTVVFDEVQEPRRKYILVFEGEETEVQYFDGVIQYREEIGIDPLIEVKPLLRSYREKSYSSPVKILDLLIKYLKENIEEEIKVKYFIDRIIDYLTSEQLVSEQSIYNIKKIEGDLEYLLYSELGLTDESIIVDLSKMIEKVVTRLKQSVDLFDNIDNIIKYIQEQQIVFDQKIDKVCLIIDRDPQSFKADQYDYVIQKCKDNGFDVFVSNPTFEFWLLLHSPNVMGLSREKMLLNKKERIRAKKRFLELELSKAFAGYKKTKIDFANFKGQIPLAIEQEKNFCENVVALKDQLGTNIGLLLEEIIKVDDSND